MKKRFMQDLTEYQKHHQNKLNQILHYFAFLFAFIAWILLFIDIKKALCLAVLHYLFSWIGHFYFGKNMPASFKYPFLGFYAGFLWFFLCSFELLTGKKVLPKLVGELQDLKNDNNASSKNPGCL